MKFTETLLMTPGPVQIDHETMIAGASPLLHHRTTDFSPIYTECIDLLKKFMGVKGNLFMTTSSGTGAMETAIANLFNEGETVLNIVTGVFGVRFTQICQAFRLNTVVLKAEDGNEKFSYVSDWYKWERECVKEEVINGSYSLDADVDIGLMVDFKSIYMVGEGHLHQDINGFTLKGCGGELDYSQGPLTCYSLYADYFWYEIGDIICIGDKDCLYYCFVKPGVNVAKARLATEEIFKHIRGQRKMTADKKGDR